MLVLVPLVLVAGCTAAPSDPARSPSARTRSSTRPAASHRPAARPVPPGITLSRVTTADRSVITIAAFRGTVQYVLHDGSLDPASAYSRVVRAGPVVRTAERSRLLAAFNGGFLMRSHAGGYAQEGHVFKALRNGLASLIIDQAGHARVATWGSGAPAPGESVFSVRQNLWALVLNGRPTAQAAHWWRWGGTVGNLEYVARSAVGQDAAGNLIYAASMSTTPQDLAEALARSGAVIGMELDINPGWVQLDIARAPGGALRPAIPGQVRPSSQYLTGWSRDFVTVLVPEGVTMP